MSVDTPRFVGPNQVFGVTITEDKTPSGKEIVKVLYENKELAPDVMPMAVFERLVTDVPKDYNWLRETRYQKLVDDMTVLCLENDVQFSDIAHVATSLKDKLEAAFQRATNVLWTGDDKTWYPGVHPLTFRTLLEADRILKNHVKPSTDTTDGGTTK